MSVNDSRLNISAPAAEMNGACAEAATPERLWSSATSDADLPSKL